MNFFNLKPKKVALVLGGGGARGLSHIGIMKVLEREDIKIDLVVGTSMGSVVGAAYSLGIDSTVMEKRATTVSWTDLFDPTMPKLGLIEGVKMEQVIADLLENKTFLDVKIPLAIVATDIEKAEAVTYTSGPLIKLTRASCSWPGIFSPVRHDNRLLVDGGVIHSVPVALAKNLGADFIIACDVGFCVTKDKEITTLLRLLLQSFQIMGEELNTYQSRGADIIIEPELGDMDQIAFDKSSDIIHKGQEAAEKALPALRKVLGYKKRRFRFMRKPIIPGR